MKSCSICKAPIESENPSVLTMGGYGNPRYVCECCDGDHLARIGCEDNAVIKTMEEMVRGATARAEAIREGTYDFSEDEAESAEEEMIDIPEELRETEEDRALDEREEAKAKKMDKIMDHAWIVLLVLFGAALAYLLIRRFI